MHYLKCSSLKGGGVVWLFLVGEFYQNEPHYYSGKFFVRPQNVCVVDTFYRTTKVLDYRVPPFFGTVRLFEFLCRQRVPLSSFLIFCSQLKFQKAQTVSPFKFFGTMRLFQNSHFSFFFSENFFKKF